MPSRIGPLDHVEEFVVRHCCADIHDLLLIGDVRNSFTEIEVSSVVAGYSVQAKGLELSWRFEGA
jgi:hypothetical protein